MLCYKNEINHLLIKNKKKIQKDIKIIETNLRIEIKKKNEVVWNKIQELSEKRKLGLRNIKQD